MTSFLQTRASRPAVHVAVLLLVVLEIVGIEISTSGTVHHIIDAVVFVGLALCMRAFTLHIGPSLIMFTLGGVAWSLDFLGMPTGPEESLLWGALHAFLAVVLMERVMRVKAITNPELADALSIYLLVAMTFANVYNYFENLNPSTLLHTGTPAWQTLDYGLIVYYSFITQLTVGYGDIVPGNSAARILSVVQSMFGVLYLATLVSKFVSMHHRSASDR